jgi:adenylate cyclase
VNFLIDFPYSAFNFVAMTSREIEDPEESSSPLQSDTFQGAWLEIGSNKLPIAGGCSIGRSPQNVVVLDSPKVSRRHAIVNVQNVGEFWLIDLGSSNGTFLNERRIHQPIRLSDYDQFVIGDSMFTFRQAEQITDDFRTMFIECTIREIENIPCWMLLADIENFTPLSRSLTSDELAELIGRWIATCKGIIEDHGGMIDKYLGDGFFAYWREGENAVRNVTAALSQLKQEQERRAPRFRLAFHFGLVAIGGVPLMGEESLMGKDVNFIFRMEKLAASLGIFRLTSAAGKAKLDSVVKCEPAGAHELKGFEGNHEFFSW